MKLPWSKEHKTLPSRELDDIKSICKILFIDDKKFAVVDILDNAGWRCTRRIRDVNSLDQMEVSEAQILFVDIQGVGVKLKFKDEGLGLIQALKRKYPNKKIIAYSAEDQGQVQAFHPGIDAADARLSKTADPYQFEILIEKFAKEAFSLPECVARIQKDVLNQYGKSYNSEEVITALGKVYNNDDFSTKAVSKAFSLKNASSIATIVQLFFSD